MSIFLQIAIGLVPALLVFVVLAITQKKARLFNFITGGVFLAAAASLLVCHFVITPTGGLTKEARDARLGLVYAVAYEDDGQELATSLLNDLRSSDLDSGELVYCDALLRAANGDYVGAKALATKAKTLLGIDTDKLVSLCNAVYDVGGMADSQAMKNLKGHARKQLKENIPSDVYSDTAEAMIESDQLFRNYVVTNELDKKEVSSNLRALTKKLEEHKEIANIPQVRMTRMKLQILSGDYKDTAEALSGDAGYDELAVISELYLGGIIRESSFSEAYGEEFKHQAESVCKQLEKIKDKLSPAQKKQVKTILSDLDDASSSPAIGRLKNSIQAVATDKNSPDRSKAYLQLAKMAYHDGKTDEATAHINASLETVGMTDDDNYLVPMANIVQIVTDNSDPEKLKNIATYVDQVTTFSSDEMVVKVVSQEEKPNEGEEEKPSFGDAMTDSLNQTRIMLDISHVDSTRFNTVTATINIDNSLASNADELKELLIVRDCGVEITDFTVEKVDISAINILLCCDVSGSMSGTPINDLKKAVVEFVQSSPDIENIALITFSGSVEDVYSFGTSKDTIINAANGIYASGGTNMYNAIIQSLNHFSSKPSEINYILLLGDGQDGYNHSMEELDINIGTPAQNKGIVLYSLGMGSGVDSNYMQQLASVTNGEYMHVTDSQTLGNFYAKLRNQAMNRYRITYKAQDTLAVNRNVHIAYKENPTIVSDTYRYSIGAEGEMEDIKEYKYTAIPGLSIRSLSTGLIYKSPLTTEIQAFGEGFKSDFSYSVKLDGALDYDNVPCTFVNGTTLQIVIPGGIACGTYDVRITVNGRTAILTDAIHVVSQGSERTTNFGPYSFTSYSKSQSGDVITLDNYVTMNGWLGFRGEITLTGNLSGQTIYLTDRNGSYIRYNVSTAQGYAATLANRGEVLDIGALGQVRLYNDPDHAPTSDDYLVQRTQIPALALPNLLLAQSPYIKLYPSKLEFNLNKFNTDLPFQDTLVKDTAEKLFSFDYDAVITATNTQVGMKIEAEMGTDPKGGKTMASFGKMSIPIYKGSLKLSLDTLENEFAIDANVEIPALIKGNDTGLGLKLEWKQTEGSEGFQKLHPSTIQIGVDYPIKANFGGVPITLDDFKLGVEDIDPNASILDCKLVGSMDIGTSKVSDYLPGLDNKIGNASLLKLDDTTLEFSIGQQYIGVKTEMKLLDDITLGKMSIEAGKMPFTVALLGIYNEEAYGFRASLGHGIIWENDVCDFKVYGEGTLSVHSKLLSCEVVGETDINLHWWFLNYRLNEKGSAVVAFYTDNQNRFTFAAIARGSTLFGAKEYYLTWNNETHLRLGSRRL